MSGGQGSDEQLPEAVAMKEYAIAQGVPEGEILVETNSTTTYENMKFSKKSWIRLSQRATKQSASNNYHIFRAGLYADQAQLKADGIGAPTAFTIYRMPFKRIRGNPFMHKRRHLTVLITLLILYAGAAILQLILAKQTKKFFEPVGSKNFFLLSCDVSSRSVVAIFFHAVCKGF